MKESKKKRMYVWSRLQTQCNQKEWARLFTLGSSKGMSHVSEKENGDRGVNMPEALAAQLLMFLYKNDFDVKNIQFDADGNIISIPKKS